MRPLASLMKDYKQTNDIFSNEEELTIRIKEIIWNDLDEVDRRIILMYADLGSLRKLGQELGVSGSAAHQRVKQIKQQILDKL